MSVYDPIDPILVAQVMSSPYLGPEEEQALIKEFQETGSPRARDRIVLSHGRLVLKAVKKMAGYGLSQTDLFQEGQIGLIEALKRFDLGKRAEAESEAPSAFPYRFATYASWWVKAVLNEFAIRGQSLVKMGTTGTQRRLFFKVKGVVRAIESEFPHLPRKAVMERAAERLDCLPAEVEGMFDRLSHSDTSLNVRVGEAEDGDERGDYLVDPSETPDVVVARKIDNERRSAGLMDAVASLDPRSRRIVEARYLAEPDDLLTLEELSHEFGVTRERIRQVEQKALQKLKRFLTRPEVVAAVGQDLEASSEPVPVSPEGFSGGMEPVLPANDGLRSSKRKRIGAQHGGTGDVMAAIAQQNARRSGIARAA